MTVVFSYKEFFVLMAEYNSDKKYTRKEIMAGLGVVDTGGGAWYTGYVRHDDEHYIFCNIQAEERTGQNYNNYFDGDELVWHTRKGAKISKGVAARLISNTSTTHIFYREDNRTFFSYLGPATALNWLEGESVEVRWGFNKIIFFPDEIQSGSAVTEGAKRQVVINAYERDSTARDRCIKRWGHSCVICNFDFGQRYGEHGKGIFMCII